MSISSLEDIKLENVTIPCLLGHEFKTNYTSPSQSLKVDAKESVLIFLAAMSSSRSDDVTEPSVRSYVRLLVHFF